MCETIVRDGLGTILALISSRPLRRVLGDGADGSGADSLIWDRVHALIF